jgi:hypothetical protein
MPVITTEPYTTIVKKFEPVQTITSGISIVKLGQSIEPTQTVKLLEVVPNSVIGTLPQFSNSQLSTSVTLTSVPSIKSIKKKDILFNTFNESAKFTNNQKCYSKDLPKIYEIPNDEEENKNKNIKSIIKKKHSIKPKDEENEV